MSKWVFSESNLSFLQMYITGIPMPSAKPASQYAPLLSWVRSTIANLESLMVLRMISSMTPALRRLVNNPRCPMGANFPPATTFSASVAELIILNKEGVGVDLTDLLQQEVEQLAGTRRDPSTAFRLNRSPNLREGSSKH